MKLMYEQILEEFILQSKDIGKIRDFFQRATPAAKTGYLKASYKSGVSIVRGHYVEFGPRGIEISRDEREEFTWQQVADKFDQIFERKEKIKQERQEKESWKQMSIFDLQEGT